MTVFLAWNAWEDVPALIGVYSSFGAARDAIRADIGPLWPENPTWVDDQDRYPGIVVLKGERCYIEPLTVRGGEGAPLTDQNQWLKDLAQTRR